jgi:hypothetical protein
MYTSYLLIICIIILFILIGDRNSLSGWEPGKNRIMIILMIMFSFIVVVYLMNLFIGLLNMAIEKDNDRASYLAQKAEVRKLNKILNHFKKKNVCIFINILFLQILKDIELFYLLPHQRRWNHWFPDIM